MVVTDASHERTKEALVVALLLHASPGLIEMLRKIVVTYIPR